MNAPSRTATRYFARVLAVLVLIAFVLPAWAGEDAGVGKYPPLAEVYRQINELAAARPDLAAVEEIGKSVEGRPILMLRVGRKDGVERPAALYTANLHAGECISSQVALGVAKKLVLRDGKDPEVTRLLDQTDIFIVPVLNPDGYHRVISTGGSGGEIGGRKNANGVDLNRNYPLAPGAHSRHPLAGSRNPKSNYYMGPSELSEPETQAIARLAEAHPFYVAINGHSVSGKFLYPHCYTKKDAVHTEQMVRVGLAFEARQKKPYPVQKSYSWYPTLGDMDDFLYMRHGVLSNTVEHATLGGTLPYFLLHPRLFWLMNPPDPEPWVENDRDAVIAAIAEAFAITGGKPMPLEQTRTSGQ